MASLDRLPPDQRAVLQMVLTRGRSYDQIAEMLHIDRAGVRERALQALDALGPATNLSETRRAMITDYLLDQLSSAESMETRHEIARSPTERAWARVVASELAPLSSSELPEIPSAAEEPVRASGEEPEPRVVAAEPEQDAEAPRTPPDDGPREPRAPRSSRLGGAVLLGVGALVVIAVVVILLVNSGGSSKNPNKPVATATSTTTGTTPRTTATSCNPATSTTACPVRQINLISPTSHSTVGIAEVLRKGTTTAIAIVAQGVPANSSHTAYAVWLYNSATDALRLGYVNPGVGKNGRLQTAGALPTNAARYHQLLVTLETQPNPHSPGTIVLEGPFATG